MDIATFKVILGDNSITDDEAAILLERAKKKAVNHYFWKIDDYPTDEEIEVFTDRYEYEIYDIAKTIADVGSRDGLKQFTELGVTRVWESGGDETLNKALAAIPPKTYVW